MRCWPSLAARRRLSGLAVTAAWEALLRRLPAVTHRLVAELAQVPVEELGEPTLAAALCDAVADLEGRGASAYP